MEINCTVRETKKLTQRGGGGGRIKRDFNMIKLKAV